MSWGIYQFAAKRKIDFTHTQNEDVDQFSLSKNKMHISLSKNKMHKISLVSQGHLRSFSGAEKITMVIDIAILFGGVTVLFLGLIQVVHIPNWTLGLSGGIPAVFLTLDCVGLFVTRAKLTKAILKNQVKEFEIDEKEIEKQLDTLKKENNQLKQDKLNNEKIIGILNIKILKFERSIIEFKYDKKELEEEIQKLNQRIINQEKTYDSNLSKMWEQSEKYRRELLNKKFEASKQEEEIVDLNEKLKSLEEELENELSILRQEKLENESKAEKKLQEKTEKVEELENELQKMNARAKELEELNQKYQLQENK